MGRTPSLRANESASAANFSSGQRRLSWPAPGNNPAKGAPASGTASSNAQSSTAPSQPGPAVPPLPEGPRVERNAHVVLDVPTGRFEHVLDDVISVVDQAGGYVAGSNAEAPTGSAPQSGQITFQVPAAKFDQVLTSIRHEGTPRTITISGNDVSQQYVDLQARLQNEESQRDAMLALMQRATTVADTIQIQNQLGQVTAQIEELKGQISYLDHTTTYATVAVDIDEVVAVQDQWGIQTAATEAAHNVVGTLDFLLLALGTLAPLLVLGAVAALVGRWAWRRSGRRLPGRLPTPAE